MHSELTISLPVIQGALLVFTRVAGIFTFLPLPGLRTAPDVPRLFLSLCVTGVLFPLWPAPPAAAPTLGFLVTSMFNELAFGLTVGVALAFLLEGLQMAAQIAGLQAGYSYASTIDPNTQADSSVLYVFVQLLSAILFFVIGLDRRVIAIVGASLKSAPPGAWQLTGAAGDTVARMGSAMFTMGLRLAMPVVGFLLMVDVGCAIAGRLSAQLQLLSIAFPAKLLAGLALLALVLTAVPQLLESYSVPVLASLARLVTR
ncbi:MAG: flagellar biosynthetic protein FliR [Bryobacteraceae bacterium]|jgi:flagellar biosynthetic protein FliR